MKIRYYLGLFSIIVLCGWFIGERILSDLESLDSAEITAIDFTDIRDGIYAGRAARLPISAQVEMHVKDGHLNNMNIFIRRSTRRAETQETARRVIQNQTLDVDVVSGATYSSVLILKAMEDALKKGLPAPQDTL
ncbi:MAG: FMN-binding protein [Fibrobacterota bacterium]